MKKNLPGLKVLGIQIKKRSADYGTLDHFT